MKKIAVVSVGVLVFSAHAQEAAGSRDVADPSRIGVYAAAQRLKEVSVDKFENEGTWVVSMSSDEGTIKGRLFEGGPARKRPIPEEGDMKIPDSKVFGAKVSFYRRGYNSFEVSSVKPLPVEGVAKTVSVWVAGRGYPHSLSLLLEDFWGQRFELHMGQLDFSGWKLMSVAIPPQHVDGKTGIVQKSRRFPNQSGLNIVGFRVDCDPLEAYGNYYVYFDDLRVVTDLYDVESREPDDMSDAW
ncbi:flagellar filament outer layer protein FlaA [Treponema pallidum]|uniref:Flagellar filament outer layer protein FlaA n=3 Tax=Treponema pallidum TaxID=160 RepID=A0AAU8RR09_TREPL|nr:flagellar filament outer layer protein FlaA [Treponema pallidum]AEZ57788.1 flagellar filament outer layer protein FlaA [Treponema pallidum subsp. pertenue str. SamoaD]AEZ58857.1 flagellar filament outer layer protein FlaA [Treponema pallidum subsp. pertenue str. CDC2]AEZ59925.1 flagellar filament outer layer protein FlaA [Treponema pallidum subsp. pertenue str. Gauthier]AGK84309.1 flagellar filament outer layer protein FlaA [Treponema pallidum str. Fribourg-Blanc]AJB40685.1 flagellar filame